MNRWGRVVKPTVVASVLPYVGHGPPMTIAGGDEQEHFGGKKKERAMKRTSVAVVTMLAVLLAAAPVAAQAQTDTELDDVRRVTAAYHWLPMATDAGYVPFALDGGDVPSCFDSEGGGMGVHYVRNVDDVADATDPEAIVYELAEDGGLRLVGVEYIVPQEFVEDENGDVVSLPALLGQDFHKHDFLPLYVLHAWIWGENPEGMFADFNPEVSACPTT